MVAALIFLSPTSASDDWPQWRGPHRNGISDEKGWSVQWPADGPKQLWKLFIGGGYSSVAVVGGRLYTAGNYKDVDTIWCLDAESCKTVWKYSYPCPYGGWGGTRATPTIEGKSLYSMSRTGQVFCLDAETGKLNWSTEAAKEMGAKPPTWDFASSPLVEGGLLILNIGGAGVALDKATGKVAWKSTPEQCGYASAVACDLAGGQRCVLIFSAKGLAGVDPRDGRRILWYPWESYDNINAADPIVDAETAFISSGYKKGGALLRLETPTPKVIWQNQNMCNHFASCVLVDGHLYGSDGNVEKDGVLSCVELKTGQLKWTKKGTGMVSVIVADGKLIGITEQGDLIIAEATPKEYHELARAKVLTGKCWTPPVLSGGRIYCRNHEGTLACIDVRPAPAAQPPGR